jgi:hypothetical protein
LALASAKVNASCTGRPDDAQKAACTYAVNNNLPVDVNSMTLTENVAGMPNPNIQVIATKSNIPYTFGRVIGLSNYKVAAVAVATQGSTGATNGLFPMGIQCNAPCSTLTLDPGTSVAFGVKFTSAVPPASGNWQWLTSPSSGDNGAPGVGSGVTNGMTGTYSIGQSFGTKTGADGNAGPVKTAFSARMSSCPALSPDPCSGGNPNNIPQNDPCLVTVPAVDFGGHTGTSGALPIEVFAEVYLEPTSTSTNIIGCFVKQIDPGALASGGPALGSLGRPMLVQ